MTEELKDIQNKSENIQAPIFQPRQTKPAVGYAGQLAILIGFVAVGFVLATIATLILWVGLTNTGIDAMRKNMSNPAYSKPYEIIQLVSSVLMFFLPVVAFGIVIFKKPFKSLGFNTRISSKQIFIVVLIAVAGFLISGPLGIINELIPIPKTWQIYFHQKEDEYNDAVQAIATMKTFADYLMAVFVIAIIPAIIEESFFRGGMQQLFIKWFKNASTGIIITSVIFSIIHMSYYGFLARAALGVILGLIFFYGKNIWLNILAHFLNNGIAITQLYILTKSGKNVKELMKDDSLPFVSGRGTAVAAIVILAIGIYLVQLLFKALKKESIRLGADKIDNTIIPGNNPFEE